MIESESLSYRDGEVKISTLVLSEIVLCSLKEETLLDAEVKAFYLCSNVFEESIDRDAVGLYMYYAEKLINQYFNYVPEPVAPKGELIPFPLEVYSGHEQIRICI